MKATKGIGIEVNEDAKVWRFLSLQEAHDYARFLDGHWDHVMGPKESFALGSIESWVVFAWRAR